MKLYGTSKNGTVATELRGLKKAAGATKGLGGYYSGEYAELFFDKASGEVWTVYQYSLGQNTWTVYEDGDVIKIGNISEPMTMREIAESIARRLTERTAQIDYDGDLIIYKIAD